jgi:multidrug efflux pump subunit AcrA (membrane-fusion protein)
MKLRIILVILVCFSFSVSSKAKPKPIVSTAKAQKSTLERTLFFPVSISSKVDSKITSDGDFIVIKKIATLGQKVKKNAALMVLRNQDTSTHYENRILRSPVDGIVASIAVENGEYVHRAQDLIHINNPDKLYGKIEISAADYRNIKVGLEGKMSVTSLNVKMIPVKIMGVGAAVDQITGTISVELEINQDDISRLVPGVIGLAEITLKKEELLLVKEKSLYYIGEDVFIARLKNKKVEKVKVELGKRVKDQMEVIKGLELDSTYISESAKFLRDGEEVKVKEIK